MISLNEIRDILGCPKCHAQLVGDLAQGVACPNITCSLFGIFPCISDQPILIDFETSIIDQSSFISRVGASTKKRDDLGKSVKTKLFRALFGGNAALKRLQPILLAAVKSRNGSFRPSFDLRSSRPRVLVIGGGAIGDGLAGLYADRTIDLIGFDVYVSPNTMFIADGHAIPLVNESVDAVVIQAVLEHVLDPNQVVSEIYRVLKPDGLVLADSPFMQQVHEGAYDFTRFTLSGHRWLFRYFTLIEAGISGGPGSAALWNIRYFCRAIFRNDKIGTALQLSFFWLRYLDRFTSGQRSADAANAVYFYGRKADQPITPKDIVKFYETQE